MTCQLLFFSYNRCTDLCCLCDLCCPLQSTAWFGGHSSRVSLSDPSLSLPAEIQSCLVSSGDVGCGTFQCFNNNSCEIQGLHHICLTLLHNAGRYDSQVGLTSHTPYHVKQFFNGYSFAVWSLLFQLTIWNQDRQQLRWHWDTCSFFI